MSATTVSLADPQWSPSTAGSEGDLIDEMRDNCGFVIQGIDWPLRRIGFDLIGAILDPIAGDFDAVDAMASNWGVLGNGLDQIGQNYATIAGAVPPAWAGRAADAATGRMTGFADGFATQAEGAQLVMTTMQDMLTATKRSWRSWRTRGSEVAAPDQAQAQLAELRTVVLRAREQAAAVARAAEQARDALRSEAREVRRERETAEQGLREDVRRGAVAPEHRDLARKLVRGEVTWRDVLTEEAGAGLRTVVGDRVEEQVEQLREGDPSFRDTHDAVLRAADENTRNAR